MRKTETTALWFSSFELFKNFRQIPAAGFGKKEPMTKIRTEVFIETTETFIVKRNRTFVRTWCEDCGRKVAMVSLPEATLLTGHDAEAIRALMEKRDIHFSYLKPEMPSVCLRSLCLF